FNRHFGRELAAAASGANFLPLRSAIDVAARLQFWQVAAITDDNPLANSIQNRQGHDQSLAGLRVKEHRRRLHVAGPVRWPNTINTSYPRGELVDGTLVPVDRRCTASVGSVGRTRQGDRRWPDGGTESNPFVIRVPAGDPRLVRIDKAARSDRP